MAWLLVLVQAIMDLAGGGVDRQIVMGTPFDQGVAAAVAIEATKDVSLNID